MLASERWVWSWWPTAALVFSTAVVSSLAFPCCSGERQKYTWNIITIFFNRLAWIDFDLDFDTFQGAWGLIFYRSWHFSGCLRHNFDPNHFSGCLRPNFDTHWHFSGCLRPAATRLSWLAASVPSQGKRLFPNLCVSIFGFMMWEMFFLLCNLVTMYLIWWQHGSWGTLPILSSGQTNNLWFADFWSSGQSFSLKMQ